MDAEVTAMEYDHRGGFLGGGRRGLWLATVTQGEHVFGFSQWDGEKQWYCDSHLGHGGYPHFCHGEGSRCTKKLIATGELESELNARKERENEREAVG